MLAQPNGRLSAAPERFPLEGDLEMMIAAPVPGSPLLEGAVAIGSVAYMAFWIWMIVHCLRHDPDRYLWIWILVILPFPGAFVYFLARWLPERDLHVPKALQGLTRRNEISRLEIAAMQIGNPHHFIQWGDALREVGKMDQAGSAYGRALEKEPQNTQALWGAALVDMHRKDFAKAQDRLKQLLEIDPQYKFGDVSLAYGKTLYELGDHEAARRQLEAHVRRWRHPEALFLLATIESETGNSPKAREHLQSMLWDINGSPKAIARRQTVWKSRARKMLRKLPR